MTQGNRTEYLKEGIGALCPFEHDLNKKYPKIKKVRRGRLQIGRAGAADFEGKSLSAAIVKKDESNNACTHTENLRTAVALNTQKGGGAKWDGLNGPAAMPYNLNEAGEKCGVLNGAVENGKGFGETAAKNGVLSKAGREINDEAGMEATGNLTPKGVPKAFATENASNRRADETILKGNGRTILRGECVSDCKTTMPCGGNGGGSNGGGARVTVSCDGNDGGSNSGGARVTVSCDGNGGGSNSAAACIGEGTGDAKVTCAGKVIGNGKTILCGESVVGCAKAAVAKRKTVQMKNAKRPMTLVQTVTVNGFDTKLVKSEVSGGYFIRDDKSLAVYCRRWWDAVIKDKYNFIRLPAFDAYVFIGPRAVHFIRFKYGRAKFSTAQDEFFVFLRRLGHLYATVGTFHEFIGVLKEWGLYDKGEK